MKDKKTIIRAAIALITWFALALQLYIMLRNNKGGEFHSATLVLNFFSYFTILSNLFAAITLSVRAGSPLSTVNIRSAIAVYIFIVGLVYNLVLRNVWAPSGWQLVADNLLHVAVPVLYVIYWFFFVPKKVLVWKDIFPWLIFPAIYLVYSLARGALTGWYPYPFLNADQSGYSKVAINSSLVLAAFIIVSLIAIAINRSGSSAAQDTANVKRS
jgi:hypothetical protein